jgi:hypothetical protein
MRSTVYKKQGAPDRRSTSSITFSTRFIMYKKQGAPDRWSTHLLLLSARASPRTKSKGLHRCVLQIYYFINQVSKSFADQRVSSSLSMIQIVSHQIPIGGSIYFYLYLSSSSSSNMQKKKITKPWGYHCHRTRHD